MNLEETLTQTWALLTPGSSGKGTLASLATIGKDGGPELRTVMIRGADRVTAQVDTYADLHSAKVGEIQRNPRAAILLWSDAAQVQLRVSGEMSILSGEPTVLLWTALRADQKSAYGHVPNPGAPIPASDAWNDVPDPASFAVLTLHVTRIDHVSLDPTGHRRAVFEKKSDWVGQWLSP